MTSAAAYLLLFIAAAVSGLPLGFALFGRRHATGWVAGLLLGYALTALALWTVVYLRVPSRPAFVAAWGCATAAAWGWWMFRGRTGAPWSPLPSWSGRDTRAMLLVLLLVPPIVGPPLARIGARDSTGDRLYRAYFTADFVWHTALVAEMAKHEQPPRNPYLASQPVHYYWTYFLLPATAASQFGIDVQQALKVNAFGVALLLVAAIFLAAWTVLPAWPYAVATGVALTMLASSAEGLATMVDLLRRGRSFAELRQLNIDAMTAWWYGGLRIDDLPRTMWYTPQHAMSCALGLIAVVVATAAGARARLAAIVLAGVALAAAVTFNPLLGAAFSAVYGATILVDAARQRALDAVFKHAIAAVLVAGGALWCSLNQMTEGAGAALHLGFMPPGSKAPLTTFLLSFGPILLPAIIGLGRNRLAPLSRVSAAMAGVALSILLMFFVTLTVDVFWVGFRAGNIFFALVPALVARGFVKLWSMQLKPGAIAIALAVLLAGLPTTIIDAYNAQDVGNTAMGPGFHWTVRLSRDQQEAFDWIRRSTPPAAVVQAEPIVRDRETWSLIPSFAERRMAGGLPISLMHVRDYDERSAEVQRIYAGPDAADSHRRATALGIDYLYVDRVERAAYPEVAKFEAHPEYFQPVFRNAEVVIYALRR